MTMRKLSEPFYLVSLLGAMAGILVASLLGGVALGLESLEGYLFFELVSKVISLYAAIVECMLWYNAWKTIQDHLARTTPGKAIGFMFIPFFNLYWVFQFIWGFSKDFNAYVERHNLNIKHLPEGLFLSYIILLYCSVLPIPVLQVLIGLASAVVGAVVIIQTLRGANAVIAAEDPDADSSRPSLAARAADTVDAGVKAASPVVAQARQKATAGLAAAAKYVLSKTDSGKPLTQTDEQHYAMALSEAEGTNRRPGVWAKALADTDGDQDQAKSLYIKYRVSQMKEGINGTAEQSPPAYPEGCADAPSGSAEA